jgi:hypothetical protein
VDTDAVVANWSVMGLLLVGLGLSLTVARRTRLGRPVSRWAFVAGIAIEGSELVNLYVRHHHWTSALFFIVGIGASAMLAAASIRKRSASHPPDAPGVKSAELPPSSPRVISTPPEPE